MCGLSSVNLIPLFSCLMLVIVSTNSFLAMLVCTALERLLLWSLLRDLVHWLFTPRKFWTLSIWSAFVFWSLDSCVFFQLFKIGLFSVLGSQTCLNPICPTGVGITPMFHAAFSINQLRFFVNESNPLIPVLAVIASLIKYRIIARANIPSSISQRDFAPWVTKNFAFSPMLSSEE